MTDQYGAAIKIWFALHNLIFVSTRVPEVEEVTNVTERRRVSHANFANANFTDGLTRKETIREKKRGLFLFLPGLPENVREPEIYIKQKDLK